MPSPDNANKWEQALQEALKENSFEDETEIYPGDESATASTSASADTFEDETEIYPGDESATATATTSASADTFEDETEIYPGDESATTSADTWEAPLPNIKWEENPAEAKWKETDLYPPLKSWLESTGFTVHGEVKHCDVAACRNGELTLIEIKRTVNLELLLQLVRRQEAADTVYAAVLAPPAITRRWRELSKLLKRLEVGLILIHMERPKPLVQVAFHPIRQAPRRNKATTKALLTEMDGRGQDMNTGGSNRVKLVTAYRLQALDVARTLQLLGKSSPRQLTVGGSPTKTGNILRANHYGWFERVARGMYQLTPEGEKALVQYQQVFDQKKGS